MRRSRDGHVRLLSLQVLRKYFTGGLCGFDKDGSPIRIELYGLLDMRGLMCSAKKSDLEKSKMFDCEACVRCMNEQTKKVLILYRDTPILVLYRDTPILVLYRDTPILVLYRDTPILV